MFNQLLDSHFQLFALAPEGSDISVRLSELKARILEYKDVMVNIDKSLRGFLQVADVMHQANLKEQKLAIESSRINFENIRKKRNNKSKKKVVEVRKYQQRWQRMVGDVTDGVGSYAVELLRLDTDEVVIY